MTKQNQSPCAKCTLVPKPDDCERKNCPAWKNWWLKRWAAMRHNIFIKEVSRDGNS